jgi:hypothetical protein
VKKSSKRSSVVKRMMDNVKDKLFKSFINNVVYDSFCYNANSVKCRWIRWEEVKKNISSLVPFSLTVGCGRFG